MVEALLEAREAELQAEVEARAEEAPRVDEEGEKVPRRTVVNAAVLAPPQGPRCF